MSLRRRGGPYRAQGAGLVGLWLLASVLLGACSDDSVDAAVDVQVPSTSVSVIEGELPSAVDLGTGYEEVAATAATNGPCQVAVGEPTRRAARSFVSDAAQERIDLQVLSYKDDQTASGAFAEAKAASSCMRSPFGGAGRPRLVEIEGAHASFAVDFADQVDAVGVTVALVGAAVVVVVQSALDHGPSTAEPVGAHEAAARALARLR